MTIKPNILANNLSLFGMTIITLIAVYQKQTTVFYILYLFWCDELIRTIFDRFRYYFRKNQIQDLPLFYKDNKERFFMLFLYLIFIIVFFGFMLDRKDYSIVGNNIHVFLFQNTLFNVSVLTFLGREFYFYKTNNEILEPKNVWSKGILILHISIVLGVLFWALSTQKFQFFKEYAIVLSVVPFLVIKLLFELNSED